MKRFFCLLVGIVTIGLFIFHLQERSNARAQIINPVEPDTYDLAGKFDELTLKTETAGAIPVIVGFRFDHVPEGSLRGAEKEQQRSDIRSGQEAILGRLNSLSRQNVKQFETIPFLTLTADSDVLASLRAMPEITYIQEDVAEFPTLVESTTITQANIAWSLNLTGTGYSVAVLDTGVDKNHGFLAGKVVSEGCFSTNSGISASVCPGGVAQSTAANSGVNCPTGGCEHGTHVAGIAAGSGAGVSGVGKGASVIAMQVFSRFDATANCTPAAAPCVKAFVSDQILALERVLALSSSMNIAAVNMSLGGGQFTASCDASEPARKAVIDNLRSGRVATVISSGNSGFTNAIGAPACISTAVSVGSTGDGSFGATVDAVSSFSNSSSILSLLAPGEWITSSVPGGGVSTFSGTSMAAPHVAGAWAVLRQKNPAASVSEIQDILRLSGTSITDNRNGIAKPRLNVAQGLCYTPISVGQTINAGLAVADCQLSPSRFVDIYTFRGTAGQQISISMGSPAFDTHLTLYNPSGVQIAQDDNGGGGTNARIPAGSGKFTLPVTGTYYFHATSATAGPTGAYSTALLGAGRTVFDFDADGKTDIGIFRPSVAEWWINRSGDGNVLATKFGATSDRIVPADYTGDGKSDVAMWRPASGEWFVLRSDDFTYYSFPFGANGDVPATADYDADGKADATVFRPSTATWYVFRSTGGTTIETFGANGDIPVPADYDGDGRADISIFRPANGQWWINRSTQGLVATSFGDAAVKPVQGDYTGDGKSDVAFWRPSTGDWFVLRSEDFSFFSFPFGTSGDTPAPGDYDGDGKFDATVFRSSNATWYSNRTTAGTLIQQFGATGDRPIPNAFVP